MNKRQLGQFFTKSDSWLKPQVLDFIKHSKCSYAYDPFAGEGDILFALDKYFAKDKFIGLDIDRALCWSYNDSLLNIPHKDKAIIITNPPYLSNYSAARKGLIEGVHKYFKTTDYCDLYLLALEKMLNAQDYVVAIIPETFINSNFKQKNRLNSITVIEDNPFDDTETPVLVACFDERKKSDCEINVYKNDKFINDLATINNFRIKPKKNISMAFNDKNGWLAVRCVDSTDPKNPLSFDFKENINYDWNSRIKSSSRLLTLINLNIEECAKSILIKNCNSILQNIRKDTADIILSPFKGNMKNGQRRRRLDFKTCRAIIEEAYSRAC